MLESKRAAATTISSGTPAVDDKKRTGLSFQVYQSLKSSVHRELLSKLDLEKVATVRDSRIRAQVFTVIQDLVANLTVPMSGPEKERLALEVLNEVFGLGPLEPLLQDPAINDILVNGYRSIWVERGGILEQTDVMFRDDAHLMHIIEKIVSAVGRHIDESSPMVDARLQDGSRVNVIIPPLAIDGPHLSIRRFGQTPISDSHARTAERCGEGSSQHYHFRRNRRRQDHAVECALRVHFGQRENRHYRRFGRIAIKTASRGPP